MIFVFRVVSPALSDAPASDLDGDEWTVQDTTYARASQRAYKRLEETFSLASQERRDVTSLAFVGEYRSLQAYHKAEELGVTLAPEPLAPLAKVSALSPRDVDTVLAVALTEDLRAS